MRITRNLALGLLLISLLAPGCDGGSGGSDDLMGGQPAEFVDSGTPAQSNMVRLTGTASGSLVNLQVVIGGATTSNDLYSFAFDLVLGEDEIAEYVAGSASFGPALTLTGGQQNQVLVQQNGRRITVGVTKVGGGAGNGTTSPEEVVVDLALRIVRSEMTTLTIEGSLPNAPEALNSMGVPIDTIQFDTAAAGVGGR